MKRALALALLTLSSACAPLQRPREADVAELKVVALPNNAVVEVNERFIGAARVLEQKPARLRPGKKRVTISAPGYFPHDVEVELEKGLTEIEIALRPVPR